jgi:two-component system sensor histidine kinase/response regulator
MPETSPTRILIVDDEKAQMQALCDTLRDQGYATTGCASAKAALAELGLEPFDLMLTDLMMPDTDGISLIRAALQMDKNLVCVMMTGEGTITTAVEAMKTGAFDYILKPFKLSVVLPVLSRALAMRRLRLENAELESRVRKNATELELANKELEAFSYSVSHDLRSPVRHVLGFAEALSADSKSTLSDAGRRYVDSISRSANRMSALIEGLLTLSRSSRTQLCRTQFSMAELVNEVRHDLAQDILDRNIEWNVQPLPTVTGDRVLLKEVWVNLLSNAIKYTRPRNPATITISGAKRDGEWEFCVRDNGVGFEMRFAEKLFGVFQRLHRDDEFEGTGIGLANVQRTIVRHGGRVWADSKPGEGTSIYFTLPA